MKIIIFEFIITGDRSNLRVMKLSFDQCSFSNLRFPTLTLLFVSQNTISTQYNKQLFYESTELHFCFFSESPFCVFSSVLSSLFQQRGILGKAAGGFKCRRSHLDLHALASNSFTVYKLPLQSRTHQHIIINNNDNKNKATTFKFYMHWPSNIHFTQGPPYLKKLKE